MLVLGLWSCVANTQLSLTCHNTKLNLSRGAELRNLPLKLVTRLLHMIHAPIQILSCAAKAPLDRSSLTLHCSLKSDVHKISARFEQKQAGTENCKA